MRYGSFNSILSFFVLGSFDTNLNFGASCSVITLNGNFVFAPSNSKTLLGDPGQNDYPNLVPSPLAVSLSLYISFTVENPFDLNASFVNGE